jgi:hypothetical protein
VATGESTVSAPTHYFVTDIECDGPDPARNSMLSLATVVVRDDGVFCGEFEAVLKARPDREPDPRTMQWWATQEAAWTAATTAPENPAIVMRRFADWVASYPDIRSFAARPLMFDGVWIDAYLRTFADSFVLDVPFWGRCIFSGSPLDIGTYIAGVFGHTGAHTREALLPEAWLGNHPHTHKAIDDARGYASLLARLLGVARRLPPNPDDFLIDRA